MIIRIIKRPRCSSSAWVVLSLLLMLFTVPGHAAEGKQVTLTGEVMDTWCYVSQIMGPSEAVVGTTHHVCAVWCAAGGIPVGLVDKADGEIYMILSFAGDDTSVANQKLLDLPSHEDNGIVNLTHETFGILPNEARP